MSIAALQVVPVGQGNIIPFGPVLAAGLTLFVNLKNIGTQPLTFQTPVATLTPIVGALGDFTIVNPVIGIIPPGGSAPFAITFTPTSPIGTLESATLTFFSDSANGSQIYTVTGISAQASDAWLQLTTTNPVTGNLEPAIINFGTVPPAGTNYVCTLTNKTSNTLAVMIEPLTINGYTIGLVSGSNPLPTNQLITFRLTIMPIAGVVGNQDDTNAVAITVPGQTYITDFEALYNVVLLTPAFVLTGFAEAMLIAFGPTLLQADPLNLTPEGVAFATRQFDLGDPWVVKSIERFLLRYERLGAATVSITYTALSPTGPNSNPTPITQTRTFDASTDGKLRNVLYDGQLAGDIIEITITVLANQGPLSLVLMCPYVNQRGETIEAT